MGKIIGGSALIVLAVFMFVGFLNAGDSMETSVRIATLLLAVGLPGAGGGLLLASHFRGGKRLAQRKDRLRLETLQSEILRLAGKHAGKLAVIEIVTETGMTPEDADAALRELVVRGVAEVEVSDAGLIVYAFPEVMALPDKDTSRGVLEGE